MIYEWNRGAKLKVPLKIHGSDDEAQGWAHSCHILFQDTFDDSCLASIIEATGLHKSAWESSYSRDVIGISQH